MVSPGRKRTRKIELGHGFGVKVDRTVNKKLAPSRPASG